MIFDEKLEKVYSPYKEEILYIGMSETQLLSQENFKYISDHIKTELLKNTKINFSNIRIKLASDISLEDGTNIFYTVFKSLNEFKNKVPALYSCKNLKIEICAKKERIATLMQADIETNLVSPFKSELKNLNIKLNEKKKNQELTEVYFKYFVDMKKPKKKEEINRVTING